MAEPIKARTSKQIIADSNARRTTNLEASRQQQLTEVKRVHQILRQDRVAAAYEDKMGRPPSNENAVARSREVTKAKGDVIAKYRNAGKLNQLQQVAAEQIGEVYQALQRSLFSPPTYTPRVDAGGGGKKGGKGPQRDLIDRLRPREARLFWDIYRPWSLEMGHQHYGAHTHLAIIMAVIGDNWTIAQVEKTFKLRRGGPAMKILREGLARYVDIAGIR